MPFFQRILIFTLAFLSEAGEKYALRLADFVHKRLKNEGTASVSSKTFHCVCVYDGVIDSLFMLMYILALALTIAYFLLADMDQYFAKDYTHSPPYCWFPKSEFLVSS
jgi:hypothetical protein